MPDKDLAAMLRAVIQEELQPINKRLDTLEKGQQETNSRLTALEQGQGKLREGQREAGIHITVLEKGQKQLHKDVSIIKTEVRAMWEDIPRNFYNPETARVIIVENIYYLLW